MIVKENWFLEWPFTRCCLLFCCGYPSGFEDVGGHQTTLVV